MTSVTQTDVLDPPATGGHRIYRLTAGTELLGEYRDSAYQEPKYLVHRVDGQAMNLPRLLYRVLCSLDGRDTVEIARDLSAEFGQELTADQVAFLVEERLAPAGLIAPDAVDGEEEPRAVPMPVRSDLLLALRYRAGVIPAGAADRIARVLQPLFPRPVWTVLVAAFLAVDVAIVAGGDLMAEAVAGVRQVVGQPALILAILGLTIVTGAFHEFGHVAACRYGGARPGDIGVGLYIVWPALYSNVTDSYRLDRVGRLRTDLGGIYFDAISLAVLGLLYLRTGEPWLLIALVGMHVETAWQFLPSIRLDGYYILADLVGVPDLFGYVRPALLSVLPGRPVHPRVAELKPRARRMVVTWVVVVVPTLVVWLVLFLVAAPHLIPAAWQSFVDYLDGLDTAVRTGDVLTTSLGVFQLFLLALPWVGTVLVLWMLVDVVAQKRRARGAGSRIGPGATASLRRGAALAVLVALSGLLTARVAAVASSHPATTDETRLVDAALAALHGAQGPALGTGERLAATQLTWYASLTGAFGRHTTAAAGARELAVLCTAVLAAAFITLVVLRRLRPLAVGVPLAAVLAMGPAVAELATVGPAVLGAAWTAVGAVVLAVAGRSAVTLPLAALAVGTGVATEPLLLVPVLACAAVMVLRGTSRSDRLAWWPPRDAVPDGARGGGRHRTPGRVAPRHRRSGADRWDAQRWLSVALLSLVGVLACVLAAGRGASLDGTDRTVLLLVAGVVVMGAVSIKRFRAPAAGTAALLVLAALPWEGAAAAALLVLAATALLAALMIDAVVRTPVPRRPHPLLRALVAIPAAVLVVVGTLFQPAQAPPVASADLAAWITGPAAANGTVAVPARLWGDLVRDGVAPDRLALGGSTAAAAAAWTVELGEPAGGAAVVSQFGSGPTALTVLRPAHVTAREQAEEAERAAEQAAQHQAADAEQATRRAFGSSLAADPRLDAPADVRRLLSDGAVDSRVLAVLAALTADSDVAVGAVPGTPSEDVAGVPRHQVVITWWDGRSTTRPDVTAGLSERLAAVPAPHAAAGVTPVPGGVLVGWSPGSPTPASR
jgi:putative peptide zinc metalloprotease protein